MYHEWVCVGMGLLSGLSALFRRLLSAPFRPSLHIPHCVDVVLDADARAGPIRTLDIVRGLSWRVPSFLCTCVYYQLFILYSHMARCAAARLP